jgi:hypothetical protein
VASPSGGMTPRGKGRGRGRGRVVEGRRGHPPSTR